MTHIPHELIFRSIIHIVYSNSELYRAEARCQMTRILRALLDDILTQLTTIARQLIHRQFFKVGRRVHPVKEIVFYAFK
jgi:hypothetical protein